MAAKYIYDANVGTWSRKSDGYIVQPGPSEGPEYEEYSAYISQPNAEVEIINETIYVPESVTPRQIRMALNKLGLRSTVENAISSMDQDAKDTWEFSNEIQRTNPLVIAMGTQLGADLDVLFILAASM